MKPTNLTALALALGMGTGFIFSSSKAMAASGLATRNMNPMLQSIFLPRYRNPGSANGWMIDHNIFITNTLEQQSRGNESLFIDVENYQYLLDINLRKDAWVFRSNLPFIANNSGELDGLIENWHEFFGFPEGKRPDFPRDNIQIEYTVDGVTEYSQTDDSSGIGDISLQAGYLASDTLGYYAGIELPTGSESDYSGNEATDIAFWVSNEWAANNLLSTYALLGISFPGDGGALEGILENEIWVVQLGLDYRFKYGIVGLAQLDYHSEAVGDSSLKALGHSLQLQLGLSFEQLFENHRLDLFFSEDIQVGSAPDITFGLRVAQSF